MLPILALATLTLTPTIGFTSDSVYKNENIIIMEVKENYEEDVLVSKDLLLKERNLLGYMIYDNPDTPQVDGLKIDNEFVYDWTVKDFNDEIEHTITVKTIYTDDIAGMLAAAKHGDWSKALSNPLILFQVAYYALAALSLIVGGIGLFKAKMKKVKDHEVIARSVDIHAKKSSEEITTLVEGILDSVLVTTFTKLQNQNQAIIEAFMLSQSGDKESKKALLDLLKANANQDVTTLSKDIHNAIEKSALAKEKAKAEVKATVDSIIEGTFKSEEDKNSNGGGISI